jgi:hypothetical protein
MKLRFLFTVFDFFKALSRKLDKKAINVKTKNALKMNNNPSRNI